MLVLVLRTADVFPCSSLLRDVSQTSANPAGDKRGETSVGRRLGVGKWRTRTRTTNGESFRFSKRSEKRAVFTFHFPLHALYFVSKTVPYSLKPYVMGHGNPPASSNSCYLQAEMAKR